MDRALVPASAPQSTSPELVLSSTFSPPSPPSTSPEPVPCPTFSPPSPPSTSPEPIPSPTFSPPSPVSTYNSPTPPQPSSPPVGLIVGIISAGILVAIFSIIFYCSRRKKGMMRENGLEEYYSHENPLVQTQDGPSGTPAHQLRKNPPPDDNKVAVFPTSTPILSYPAPSASSSSGSEKPPPRPSPGMAMGLSQSTFTYEQLAKATEGFSSANLLGQGGFGYVHKGVLPNGKVVAIKQLKAGSGQGEREFQAEVEVISRVHHRHLVSLVGYCTTGAQRMLIYEFVPNGTLEFHLHGKGRPTMSWPTRMKIALGSAKGLAYLHEDCQPKIIHRDIKAANILLDNEFEAKVADFGLAKFSQDTDTHVSTRVMGTFGYLAPEYASSGKLTDKSDVFSFGVVLLELITGRHPIDKIYSSSDDSMVEWARPLLMQALEKGNFDGLVDPKLQNDYNSSEMTLMIACASACVRHSARLRPRMSLMVRALEGNISLDDLNEGIKPGHSTVYSSYGSGNDYNSSQYKEDLQKFRKLALESQEQGTNEYSAPSTESGLNPSASSTEGQQTTEEIESEKIKKDTPSLH